MGKIIKEIDLSNLPRHIDGHQKNRIDWNNSVGEICKFKYDDIEGYVEIIAYMQNTQMITIRYKDRYDTLAMSHFRDCGISKNIKNNKTYKGFKFKFISWEEYYENK